MAGFGKRLRIGGAAPVACALAALHPFPAAASDLHLFTADTLEVSGDVRLVAVGGERSWVDGGFGKLRSGSDGDLRVRSELGNANLVWQPQFTWSLSATVVGSLQGGQRTEAGLSQAYLSFRPLRGERLAVSARAGLMWPPVSLEHEGADWHVKDSITPSAINSWIGEEVRPAALEGTLATDLGAHKLRATAALIAANDTSATLLAFRGWALHDRTTFAFRRQPLSLDDELEEYQAPFTHPLLDVRSGFAHRPGYYAKLAWTPPVPVRFELFRYDNRADPEAYNDDLEWGWRTRFNHLGVIADLGSETQVRMQALSGHTRMGMVEDGRRWIATRFRSAFALLTRPVGAVVLSGRIEAFGTRNRGSELDSEYDDSGWAAMAAGARSWGPITGLVELLHVSSTIEERDEHGLEPRQRQTQVQAEVRMRW
ncbi:MAG: hypothetical protein ACJ8FL_00770 [Sphingomicrobium sp.]